MELRKLEVQQATQQVKLLQSFMADSFKNRGGKSFMADSFKNRGGKSFMAFMPYSFKNWGGIKVTVLHARFLQEQGSFKNRGGKS